MSTFHDVCFPLPLAFGATGGPQIQTEIITLANGREQRNATRGNSRRRYDAGVGVKSLTNIQTLIAFFEARRGQLYGFRFRDPLDNASAKAVTATDQNTGIGDGLTKVFQLSKSYSDMSGNWNRMITKPVAGSVKIAVDGIEIFDFEVDVTTGLVTLTTAPDQDVIITAGFRFDVPVRFDTDHLNASLESFGAGGVVHVPLIEILPYA